MKREIKFRGKVVNNVDWVCGYYSLDNYFIPIIQVNSREGMYSIKVDPKTVGQYTELPKNPVELYGVYEDDIVKISWVTDNYSYMQSGDDITEHEVIAVVAFKNGRFIYMDKEGKEISPPKKANKEVIGNIHDNPELL